MRLSWSAPRARYLSAIALLLLAVGGCSALRPTATPLPTYYALDRAPSSPGTGVPLPAQAAATAPTLIVSPPHAASGFDSQRIIYVRQRHTLEYFSHSEWIDTPARMLAPLLVGAIAQGGAFRAVVLTPSAAGGELRLDSEIVRLQQEFDRTPSRIRFTLRAYMVDTATRQVLAWREFDATVAAASDDPYAGVIAANSAVQAVLNDVAAFSSDTATAWQVAIKAGQRQAVEESAGSR